MHIIWVFSVFFGIIFWVDRGWCFRDQETKTTFTVSVYLMDYLWPIEWSHTCWAWITPFPQFSSWCFPLWKVGNCMQKTWCLAVGSFPGSVLFKTGFLGRHDLATVCHLPIVDSPSCGCCSIVYPFMQVMFWFVPKHTHNSCGVLQVPIPDAINFMFWQLSRLSGELKCV